MKISAAVAPLRLRSMAVALCVAALGGCSSVPVSTLYKLSQLNDKDIENIDPREIRAALEVPEDVGLDASKITISVDVRSPSLPNVNDGVWPVVLVSSGRYVPLVISPAGSGRKQYLYKLSPDAETKLAAVLAEVKAHPDPATKVAIEIHFDRAEIAPPGMKSLNLSAWLQLRRADGPLLLVDDRVVTLDEPKAGKS